MAWKTSYYHYDAVGSTRMLTDAEENVRVSYNQTAFRETLSSSSSVTNPFRFVGQVGYYFDESTGLFNVRQRVYDSTLARWLTEDPPRSDHNLYRYVGNSPLFGIDPSGLANVWNIWTWDIRDPNSTWGHFFNPLASENIAFWTGGVRGGVNTVKGAGKAVREVAYQGVDEFGSVAEIVSRGGYRHQDWSDSAQAIISGQLSVGRYYGETGGNLITLGVYGQAQAGYQYYTGSISADEASERIGGTALFQLGGAYVAGRPPSGIMTPSGGLLRPGATLYRVAGGEARVGGSYFTTVHPEAVSNFRAAAGLFEENTGNILVQGTLRNLRGVWVDTAAPGPTTPPGALQIPEVFIPNPARQIRDIRVSPRSN